MKTCINSELSLSTLQYFFDEVESKLIADLAFQASDLTRWSNTKATGYVTSVMRGMAPSPFILVDVDKAYQNAKDNHRIVDIEYYNKWIESGIKYLNIDSNNRTINLKRFINDEFPIMEGDYLVEDTVYQIVKGKNDTFSKLPSVMKEFFMKQTISIVMYTNPTREELSEIFININDGQPLNHPEKRNAITSNIASVVRNLSEKYREDFYQEGYRTVWFNKQSVIRRGIDDFIAGMMTYYFTNNLTVSYSPLKLWEIYQPNSTSDKGAKSFEDEFNRFMRFFRTVPEFYMIPNRNSIFDLWIIWCQMKQDRRDFVDSKKSDFVKKYVTLLKDLLSNGKDYKFEGPVGVSGYTGTKPYETLVGGRQASNNIMRNKLITEQIDITKYTIQKDSKRNGTKTDKFILAVNNNLKTHEGKPIDPKKLHTPEYHKGHKVPYVDGGKSVRENLVIQTAEDNLKTGTKTIG